MELAVQGGETGGDVVRVDLTLGGEDAAHARRDVDGGAEGDDALGRVALGEDPRLGHLADLVRRDRHHQRAAFRVEPQQALDLQAQERLAGRRAGQFERPRRLTLADQVPAGKAAVEDALLDPVVDALTGRAGPGRILGGSGV
ncbi:hypothetical protein BJF85_19855 [Saccharomonospora sp. CUA-673]|nr:hypothetical protein BJF85_19855 [Saccharomonospora sp. CUA-673]